jgi:hypothetical protein
MPSEKDFAVGAVGSQLPGVPSGAIYAGGVAAGSPIRQKPCYLVVLDGVGKVKMSYFVSIDKPDFINGFIQVKGFYVEGDHPESEVIAGAMDLVKTTPKENIMEVHLPWHRIHNIRSLVFNAHKPTTVMSGQ